MNEQKIKIENVQNKKQRIVVDQKFKINTIKKKFSNKFTKFFEIKKIVDKQTYRLRFSIK